MLLDYLLAIVMVLSVGILLLLSLAASVALPWLVDFLGPDFPVGSRFWRWLDAECFVRTAHHCSSPSFFT